MAEARTEPGYELRDLGALPGMVRGGAGAVIGEVYEVDAASLAALDRLEGHPRFNTRTRIALEDGTAVDAYLLAPRQVAGRPVILSGAIGEHTGEIATGYGGAAAMGRPGRYGPQKSPLRWPSANEQGCELEAER
jgi:gamma-glutamylaminecyclotransferase